MFKLSNEVLLPSDINILILFHFFSMSNSFPFATHPLKTLFANGKSKASRKLRIQTQSSRDMRDSNKIALEKRKANLCETVMESICFCEIPMI